MIGWFVDPIITTSILSYFSNKHSNK